MAKVRSFSLVQTIDGSFWYSGGYWIDPNFPNCLPCILAYVPDKIDMKLSEKIKPLDVDDKRYFKVFGTPIDLFRQILRSRADFIFGPMMGKVAFVDRQFIVDMRDPKDFVPTFLAGLKEKAQRVGSLIKILGTSITDIGITGSSLIFRKPVSRHEIDFAVYGTAKSRQVHRLIQKYRDGKIFSLESCPPWHLPFNFKGAWFDPQFSESDNARHYLHGCHIERVGTTKNVTLEITDDRDGIFSPARYRVSRNQILLTFRTGHRGLFKTGQTVYFKSLSHIQVTFPGGKTIEMYGILDDEWGEII